MARARYQTPWARQQKYAKFIAYTEAIANMTTDYSWTTALPGYLVATWTGAGTGDITFNYQLPAEFHRFIGDVDDVRFLAKQTGDSGDGADVAVAVEVYDALGSNISDGTLTSAVTSVASYVTLDCGITDPDSDGVVLAGDYISLVITIAGTIENNDVLTFQIPKILCGVYI